MHIYPKKIKEKIVKGELKLIEIRDKSTVKKISRATTSLIKTNKRNTVETFKGI
jgi:hypothetical protein